MKTNWKEQEIKKPELKKKTKNPSVLAFSAYFHDSSACIIKNGKIIAAVDEERFTRKKHDNGFPLNAIKYCLKKADLSSVDFVVFFEDPEKKYDRVKEMINSNTPDKELLDKIESSWKNTKSKEAIQKKLLQETGLENEIIFMDHHLSHAASTYLVSGFEDAAILTIDGVGEKTTTAIGFGEKNNISLKKVIEFPHSVGLLYTAITTFIGFRANNDEYKVMGLAPYGDMNKDTNNYYKKLKEIVKQEEDGSFWLDMNYFGHSGFGKAYTDKLSQLLGVEPRIKDSEVKKEHQDIAAALQMITEEVVLKILNYLYDFTKKENLCIAGGVGLNSVLNGKILKNTPFKKIFIQPSSGDSGTVIGSAKLIQHESDPELEREKMTHAYYGPEYSDEEMENYLKKNNIKYKKFSSDEDLLKTTASLIKDKKIIGWFHGRMEWGPRALGNRSILASPLTEDMRDIINAKVKHREMFRPFAPVICEDDAKEYFECDIPVPEPTDFMLMVYPINEEKREKIPAVTHVDGSGRLQTIRRNQNYLYYDLIKEFGKLTEVPILINTSFNIRGEPIVCTPHDAYRCMMGTEIDTLIMGPFLINRMDNPKDLWDCEVNE